MRGFLVRQVEYVPIFVSEKVGCPKDIRMNAKVNEFRHTGWGWCHSFTFFKAVFITYLITCFKGVFYRIFNDISGNGFRILFGFICCFHCLKVYVL